MATFRFRANRWQARVRRLGTPEQTKSFLSRQDAERWARSVEVEIDKGSYVSPSGAQRTPSVTSSSGTSEMCCPP